MDGDKGVGGPRRVGVSERTGSRVTETEPGATRAREEAPAVARERHTVEVTPSRDSARWGPIWAGLITVLTTYLLLELLALGTGLLSINLDVSDAGQTNSWVSAIVGLIAFFTGGSVAGMTSSVRGTATGLLNGFLVWALGTVLILTLSALGLGQIFGALGNVLGQLNLLQGGLNVPGVDVDPQQILGTLRTTALAAFFSLLLSAIAAAIGGWLGGRTSEPIGHSANMDRT